jgi:general secretion pathway protein G
MTVAARDGRTTMKQMAWAALVLGSLASAGEPCVHDPGDAQRARWTMLDMRSWATALEEYRIDNGRFPADTELAAVRDHIQPAYIRTAPMEDAWGQPYVYRPQAGGQGYELVSGGADGKLDPKSWEQPLHEGEFPEDGVVRSGKFHRSWVMR